MKGSREHTAWVRESAFPWLLLAFAAMGLPSSVVFAESIASQFVAEDFNGAVWNSRDGSSALSSEHTATNGWGLAWSDGGLVCFDASTSPLAFPDSATGRVTRAFAVVVCEEAADHATLFDASCSVRFMPSPFPGDDRTFYESQLTNAVALSIDATPTSLFPAASGLQLMEPFMNKVVSLVSLRSLRSLRLKMLIMGVGRFNRRERRERREKREDFSGLIQENSDSSV